jgi:hypothetical protein
MDTIAYGAPRLSRAKALIGALLATLAIAGATQAATPDSASAMPRVEACHFFVVAGTIAESLGYQEQADALYAEFNKCIDAANKAG